MILLLISDKFNLWNAWLLKSTFLHVRSTSTQHLEIFEQMLIWYICIEFKVLNPIYALYLDTDLTERWQEVEMQYLNTGENTLTYFHFFVQHAPHYVVLSYNRIKDGMIKINMESQWKKISLNTPYHQYVSFKILALLLLLLFLLTLLLLLLLLLALYQRTN